MTTPNYMIVKRDTGEIQAFRRRMFKQYGITVQFKYYSSADRHDKYEYWLLKAGTPHATEVLLIKRDTGGHQRHTAYMERHHNMLPLFSVVNSSYQHDLVSINYIKIPAEVTA